MKETKKPKKLPTCPLCREGFFDCLVVDDEKGFGYHLKCLEIKKTESIMNKQKPLKPIHPGYVLKTEFLEAKSLTIEEIAQDTELDKKTLEKFLEGKISINPKIASELGSFFKMSADFWLNLQEKYWEQTENLREEKTMQRSIKKEEKKSKILTWKESKKYQKALQLQYKQYGN